MKRTLIACAMMEQEIKKVCEQLHSQIPVIWLERGFHNTPEKLKEKLQNLIDELQDQDEILLTYGLCGKGTEGLVSAHAVLVLPKFDDCINMLLCHGKREVRGLAQAGTIYLTEGWIQDEESILNKHAEYAEAYGEEMAEYLMETMYANYKTVAVIDTKCGSLTKTLQYAEKTARTLNLDAKIVDGSTEMLKRLLTGQWDENFIVQQPGKPIAAGQWDV